LCPPPFPEDGEEIVVHAVYRPPIGDAGKISEARLPETLSH
jgi:hypothetical protein